MTKGENTLLKLLEDLEIDIFTRDSLLNDFNVNLNKWRLPFKSLVNQGYFDIIEKGKYCRHNFRNEYVIGNYLVSDGVIAYWSALNLHGLTEQFANTIFVQTTKQKKNKMIFGVKYNFIKVKPQKLVEVELQGYGNHQFRITGKEKTIIDCFDLPQYSGGYGELIRAFVETDLDSQKLIDSCEAVNNIAVIKRLGYLTDLFEKGNLDRFKKYAFSNVNKRYSLFDPLGKDEGKHIVKWKLRLNMSEDSILEITSNLY